MRLFRVIEKTVSEASAFRIIEKQTRLFAIVMLIALIIGGTLILERQISPHPVEDIMPISSLPVKKVTFLTPDNVTIVGNYYPLKEFDEAILLLHMMPQTKESWDMLAKKLQENNIVTLAIDLRGHGESIKKGSQTLDYTRFSDKEHQESQRDVEAALNWLKKETNLDLSSIYVGGASIGANLSLQALAEHSEIGKGFLLSPGFDYRGIKTNAFVKKLNKDQEVFFVTSKDDGDNVAQTQKLYNATSAQKQWKVYDKAGHGTTMLQKAGDLLPSIIEFLLK